MWRLAGLRKTKGAVRESEKCRGEGVRERETREEQ